MHISIRHLFLLLFALTVGTAASPILKYGPTNIVTGVVDQGDSLWFTTGGGLICFSHSQEEVLFHEHSNSILPDISLRTPVLATDGTLWFTSAAGYLYHRTKRGKIEYYEDMIAAESVPYSLVQYDENHLLIGHSKGISIFDISEERFISTASEGAVEGRVFTMFIEEDTLFAGVEKQVVRLDSLESRLLSQGFRVDTNWIAVDTMDLEVNGLVHDTSGIQGFTRPAVMIDNDLYYGKKTISDIEIDTNDDGVITNDTTFSESFIIEYENNSSDTVFLKSGITGIKKVAGEIVVSSEEDYVFRGVVEQLSDNERAITNFKHQDTLPGIIFGQYQNSVLARTGDVWLATTLDIVTQSNRDTWWRGIHRLTPDEKYFHYNQEDTEGFGSIENLQILSMTESTDGKIWSTTWGGSGVKMWDPAKDVWVQYCPTDPFGSDNSSLEIITDGRHKWSKCDAVVQDSMGYMWIVQWAKEGLGLKHRFLIVDPETDSACFRFSRENTQFKGLAYLPSAATVDSKGNRIFIDPESGQRLVINASIDPFTDTTELYTEGVGHFFSEVSKPVSQLAPAPTGGAVITAGKEGLGLIRNDIDSIVDNGIILPDNYYHPNSGDFKKAAISAVVERASVEYNVSGIRDSVVVVYDSVVTTEFWASLSEVGVERFTLVERIKDRISEAILVLAKNPTILPIDQRYSFGPPGKLMLDHERDLLWMSSEKGLYRYQLGYSATESKEDNSNVRIYPNPFSKNNHDIITIDYLDPNAYIDIYTISGKLLAHFDQTNSEYFIQTGKGSIFKWNIPSGWAPGTYIVAAKSSEKGATELKKFLIVP